MGVRLWPPGARLLRPAPSQLCAGLAECWRIGRRLRNLSSFVGCNRLDKLVEICLTLCVLGLEVGDFLLQRIQAIFLLVELPRVALNQSLFFRCPFERLLILAYAGLVLGDGVNFVLPGIDLGLKRFDLILLIEHAAQSTLR